MPPKDRWTPKIRKRTDGKGFTIDLGTRFTGRRQQLSRPTMQEAREVAKEAADRFQRLGPVAGKLKPEEMIWAADAMEILPTGVTLRDSAECYLKTHRLLEESETQPQDQDFPAIITIGFAIEELIRNMTRTEKRARSIESARSVLRILFADVSTPVDSYVLTDLHERLDGHGDGKSAQTRKNYVAYVKQLFAYILKRGWIEADPSEALDKPVVERGMAEFMPVDQVLELIHNTQGEARLQLLLGFFAGIRPEEISKLHWSAVNIEEEMITILPAVAKTRAVRHITISENLSMWLQSIEFVRTGSPLIAPNFNRNNRVRVGVLRQLGFDWPQDCARHTFGTMHCAMFKDPARTASEMGHANGLDVFFNHYRGLATKSDAEKYWEIGP